MNGADTAWIIVATALVLFMTLPGIALFYGGLVRARNVLSVFMQCYTVACLMGILWLIVGYSIAFGDASGGLWGGLNKALLLHLTPESLAGTLPEILFFAFQMTFAIITPVLIVGSYVERIGFGFAILFSGLWMLLVYAPVVHWVWGGGFLSDGGIFGETGVRDFAGGIVVHETAGLAALVIAAFLGPRRQQGIPPHRPGYVMIGGIDAVGRVVRLQRGIPARRGRNRGHGHHRDPYLRRRRLADLGPLGADPLRSRLHGRHRHRHDRRTCLDHPGFGLRRAIGSLADRRDRRNHLPRSGHFDSISSWNRRYLGCLCGAWFGRDIRHSHGRDLRRRQLDRSNGLAVDRGSVSPLPSLRFWS